MGCSRERTCNRICNRKVGKLLRRGGFVRRLILRSRDWSRHLCQHRIADLHFHLFPEFSVEERDRAGMHRLDSLVVGRGKHRHCSQQAHQTAITFQNVPIADGCRGLSLLHRNVGSRRAESRTFKLRAIQLRGFSAEVSDGVSRVETEGRPS